MWLALREAGWCWERGRGLVNMFFLRPKRSTQPPHREGVDFFTSEDAVIHYVKEVVRRHLKGAQGPGLGLGLREEGAADAAKEVRRPLERQRDEEAEFEDKKEVEAEEAEDCEVTSLPPAAEHGQVRL